MALLLQQLEWADEPLVPRVSDPAWDADVQAFMGMVPDSMRRVASSRWVRRAYLDATATPTATLSDTEAQLAAFVTSQENACRYCYGVARTRLRLMGFDEAAIDRIERRAQLSAGDDRERELVKFCRDLARSKPRPSKQARATMEHVGFTEQQTAELAFVVAITGFNNRVSTLIAAEPEHGFESMQPPRRTVWRGITEWLARRTKPNKPKVASTPLPVYTGPFANLVELLGTGPSARLLQATLDGAFASDVLPPRTLGLMIAVVARTLDCGRCEAIAADFLDKHGVGPDVRREALATLGSPELTELEALVLPWTRDTVWMPEQPSQIQIRSRPLVEAIGPELFLEVVGGAALANACVRLTMLES